MCKLLRAIPREAALKVLVTGGAGFIGSHVVDALLADGHAVRVFDNLSTGRLANLATVRSDVEMRQEDLRDAEAVAKAVSGCDGVVHLGALPSVPRSIADPRTTNAVNIDGTLNVLLAALDAGASRVVFASSSSVYGATEELPKHEGLPTAPLSPYATTKLAGESYVRAFHHVYGLEAVSLRFFNVFGPRQDPLSPYAAVVPRFVTAALTGTPPTVYGDGHQSRDFTYVANAVQAVLRALSATDVGGLVMNVACGKRISLNRLLEELGAITGRDLEPEYRPPRTGDVRHSLADVSLARSRPDYRPEIDAATGLGHTVAYWVSASSPPSGASASESNDLAAVAGGRRL